MATAIAWAVNLLASANIMDAVKRLTGVYAGISEVNAQKAATRNAMIHHKAAAQTASVNTIHALE